MTSFKCFVVFFRIWKRSACSVVNTFTSLFHLRCRRHWREPRVLNIFGIPGTKMDMEPAVVICCRDNRLFALLPAVKSTILRHIVDVILRVLRYVLYPTREPAWLRDLFEILSQSSVPSFGLSLSLSHEYLWIFLVYMFTRVPYSFHVSLWGMAFAWNVRLHFPYRQYTNLFTFRNCNFSNIECVGFGIPL